MSELTRRGFFAAVAAVAAPKPEVGLSPFDDLSFGTYSNETGSPHSPSLEEMQRVINEFALAQPVDPVDLLRYQPRMWSCEIPLPPELRRI